jgi:peptidoglycan/xylan/chitin deacetylase (PgdA/CDA1 family)
MLPCRQVETRPSQSMDDRMSTDRMSTDRMSTDRMSITGGSWLRSRGHRWPVLAAVCAAACADPTAGALGSRRAALGPDPALTTPAGSVSLTVTVSLTFDDTQAEQVDAAAALEAHGLLGTFYVNSPRLHDGSGRPGASEYLSVEDARALEQHGHEIGGHTLSHPQLTSLPELEQRREISNDRRELARLGFEVRSLAYPYGDVETNGDPSSGLPLADIAAAAGYTSARDTNGFSLSDCGEGPETLPPEDAFRLRSTRSVNNAPPSSAAEPRGVDAGAAAVAAPPDTAETLLGWMDHAASCGGGWLPLIFHHVLSDCSAKSGLDYCFDLAELERLSEALANGQRCFESDGAETCYAISVSPVSRVLGEAELTEAVEVFALRNPSLERTLASGDTECIQHLQGADGTARFERSTRWAQSGEASERVELEEPYVAGAELIISRDYGACSPFVTVGSAYELALHYRADPAALPAMLTPPPTLRFVVYRLTTDYSWVRWTMGLPFAAASPGEWVRRSFTTSAVPEGTLALSFGLRLESAGGVAIDDLEMAPATEAE